MPDSSSSHPAPLQPVNLEPPQRELVEILRNIGGPVFAILDAARDPLRILGTLRASGQEYQCLYEGEKALLLEAFAPHLVQLPGDSLLLDHVVAHGWGRQWGIFAVSGEPFDTVRKHFRQFLMVKGPTGESLYFRYYDPRTLRNYLPTCSAREIQFIFGPIAAYLCEDEDPNSVLVFQPGRDSTQREAYPLAAPAKEEDLAPAPTTDNKLESLKAALFA